MSSFFLEVTLEMVITQEVGDCFDKDVCETIILCLEFLVN